MIRITQQRHIVSGMDFFPDGSHLVTVGGQSRAIWIWNLQNPEKPKKHMVKFPEGTIWIHNFLEIFVSNKDEIICPLLISSMDGSLKRILYLVKRPEGTHRIVDVGTTYSHHNLVLNRSCIVSLQTPQNWRLIDNLDQSVPLKVEAVNPHSIWISPNREWVAHRGPGAVRFVNQDDPQKSMSIPTADFISEIHFSPSSEYVVLSCFGTRYEIYQVSTQKLAGPKLEYRNFSCFPEFTPDERRLLIGSGSVLQNIDWRTGSILSEYDFQGGNIRSLKISDDGLVVALNCLTAQLIVADLDY